MAASDSITIRDAQSGTQASIAVARGFNCHSFRPVIAGAPLEALWSADDFLSGAGKPSRSGIPILFPFAGRIRGTQFQFEGKDYPLSVGDDFGNAIHGFVMTRPWRVIEQSDQRLVGEFQASMDDASLLAHWPADFRLRYGYEVRGNRLLVEVEAHNPDRKDLPFWFGTHAYFRVPLSPANRRAETRITVPAQGYWKLDALLPTGQVAPIDASRELRDRQFAGLKIDDILTQLEFADGRCTTRVRDAGGPELTLEFGAEYGECVVFTPPHGEAICIEPYTSVSNAFELEAGGVRTGLRILKPGESFRSNFEIRVE